MSQDVLRTFTATTTGIQSTRQGPVISAGGAAPFSTYGLQVKGTGAAATAWSVTLSGSLDGVNFTTLITHNSGDGSVVWETTGKPCAFIQVNVASLTLSPATAIVITAIAVP